MESPAGKNEERTCKKLVLFQINVATLQSYPFLYKMLPVCPVFVIKVSSNDGKRRNPSNKKAISISSLFDILYVWNCIYMHCSVTCVSSLFGIMHFLMFA